MRDIKFKFIYKGLRFSSENNNFNYHVKIYALEQLLEKPLYRLSDVDDRCELIAKCQYTGLKDKEGADLYEDDVCNVEGLGLCVVAICPMYGAIFKTKDNQEAPLIDCDAESDLYEKVGNIHQNPELLK